ncbi:MAG: hypothetical protein MJ025_03675 [Victivallaceae bacterium]|nr:hypothetical protein [Victivallaceae bacterium]
MKKILFAAMFSFALSCFADPVYNCPVCDGRRVTDDVYWVDCSVCHGQPYRCSHCNGTGNEPNSGNMFGLPCSFCGGFPYNCPACFGSKKNLKHRTITCHACNGAGKLDYDRLVATRRALAESQRRALMGMLDAEISKENQKQRDFERRAKQNARMEYQNNTHRSFDENNPPQSGTYERNEWDYCKRVYDIFD